MTDSAAIARLKAEAAQAAADAAAAKAAAAQAALDAALATGAPDHPEPQAEESTQTASATPAEPGDEQAESNGQDTPPSSNTTEALPPQTEPAPPADAPSPENTENIQSAEGTGAAGSADSGDTGYTAQVRSGYSFSSPTLPVGTYLDTLAGGDPAPVPGLNVGIPLGLLNRHALVAGATGTGKTRTLQMLAEGLSNEGVPVFLADIKGDLTGLAEPGATSEKLAARLASTGQVWEGRSFPIELFSLGGGPQSGAGAPPESVSR